MVNISRDGLLSLDDDIGNTYFEWSMPHIKFEKIKSSSCLFKKKIEVKVGRCSIVQSTIIVDHQNSDCSNFDGLNVDAFDIDDQLFRENGKNVTLGEV